MNTNTNNPEQGGELDPICIIGVCQPQARSSGISSCVHCGGELIERNGFWYHWSQFDKDGTLVSPDMPQAVAEPAEQCEGCKGDEGIEVPQFAAKDGKGPDWDGIEKFIGNEITKAGKGDEKPEANKPEQGEGKWISVNDKLPDFMQECIFTNINVRDMNGELVRPAFVNTGYYNEANNVFKSWISPDTFTATHWMPLPVAPTPPETSELKEGEEIEVTQFKAKDGNPPDFDGIAKFINNEIGKINKEKKQGEFVAEVEGKDIEQEFTEAVIEAPDVTYDNINFILHKHVPAGHIVSCTKLLLAMFQAGFSQQEATIKQLQNRIAELEKEKEEARQAGFNSGYDQATFELT